MARLQRPLAIRPALLLLHCGTVASKPPYCTDDTQDGTQEPNGASAKDSRGVEEHEKEHEMDETVQPAGTGLV